MKMRGGRFCQKGYVPLLSSVATNNKPQQDTSQHSVGMGLVLKYQIFLPFITKCFISVPYLLVAIQV